MIELVGIDNFAEPPYIVDGALVDAANTNPSLVQLYLNDLSLRNVLEYFQLPSALLAKVEIDADIEIGQPVYYSSGTGRYELASFSKVTLGGKTYLSANAEVWGLVVRKLSADTAYILIDGLYPVDITLAAGPGPHAGRYYLGDTPGTLTLDPSDAASAVFVCATAETGKVLFRPTASSAGALLAMWRRKLLGEAAGDPLLVDEHVVIVNQESSQAGWLMADNPVFGGNAPAGAKFGYNIATDDDLVDMWPPVFLQTVHLELFRDSSTSVGGTSVPLGPDGLCIVDEHGIWWMSSCLDDAPFLVTSPPHIDPEDCPRVIPRHVVFYAMKPNSHASFGGMALQSPHPALRIYRSGTTQAAAQGELDLVVVPRLLLDDSPDDGYHAVTGGDLGRLLRTPVVRSIKAGPGIELYASAETEGGRYGDVTISSTGLAGVIGKPILPATTALLRAEESRIDGAMGISLPRRRVSGINSAFHLPSGDDYLFVVEFAYWAMARFGGDDENADDPETHLLKVRLMDSPAAGGTPFANFTVLAPEMSAMVQSNLRVYEQKSALMLVPPGTTLFAELERTATNKQHDVVVLKHFMRVLGTQVSE